MQVEIEPFEIFKKDQIDKQYAKILSSIKKTDLPDIVISKISKILGRRILLVNLFSPHDPAKIIYRVTIDNYIGFDPNLRSSYSHPPVEKCKKNRANLEGFPVLYGALDFLTAVKEMKDDIKAGTVFYVSKWELNLKETISAHTLILTSATDDTNNSNLYPITKHQKKTLKSAFKSKLSKEFKDGFFGALKGMGDLFTSKVDKDYHISSAYGHFVLYKGREQKPRAVIPILIYPSVENDSKSLNYAIHPSLIESGELDIKYVYKIKMGEGADYPNKFLVSDRGRVGDNNTIVWQTLIVEITNFDFDSMELFTYDGHNFLGHQAANCSIKDKSYNVQTLVNLVFKRDEYIKVLNKILDDRLKENVLDVEEENCTQIFAIPFDHGYEIETGSGKSCIKIIAVKVDWKRSYQDIN